MLDLAPPRTLELRGWRYCALDFVTYERTDCLLGGVIGMLLSAAASWITNKRRRRTAEQLATPQWRALGPVLVEMGPELLLVRRGEDAGVIWLASVTHVEQRGGDTVVLHFDDDAPYCFQGDGVDVLTDAVTARRLA